MQPTLTLVSLQLSYKGRVNSLALIGDELRPELERLALSLLDSSKLEATCICEVQISFDKATSLRPYISPKNEDFWQKAQQAQAELRLLVLGQACEPAQRDTFLNARTTLVFDLFNQGALRGNNTAARQLLMDSFTVLPNRRLSAEGAFLDQQDEAAPGGIDKFPSLISIRSKELMEDGNRIVPGALIRNGVHVGKGNIFMFHAAVNLAAYIGDDNLIDSHASIGSAAQIGSKNKIGSFVSLEGVLSPANAEGVTIGDENFLGSFVRIGTGIRVGNKNFIGSGVNLSLGTKIKDCREDSSGKGDYLTPRDLLPEFDELAIMPNNAIREINEVGVAPGEYLLLKATPDFMARFEGDTRVKAKR